MTATKNMIIYQMDGQNCFLNGDLQEDVFVSRLKDLKSQDNPTHVYRLNKDLYGLSTAPMGRASRTDLVLRCVHVLLDIRLKLPKAPLKQSNGIFRLPKRNHLTLVLVSEDNAMSLTAFADADLLRDHFTLRHRHTTQFHSRARGKWMVETLLCGNKTYQQADILTKALPRERFEFLLPRLGMKSLTPETLKRLQEGEDE
ncbi:retrovirus-related pol polyprotein from transposon TNT 1-94 [Tanacetum coccineum]